MLYLESLSQFSLTISTDSYRNMPEQKEKIPTEMDCLHCLGIPQNTNLAVFLHCSKGGKESRGERGAALTLLTQF